MMMPKLKIAAMVMVSVGVVGISVGEAQDDRKADKAAVVVKIPSQRDGIVQFIIGSEIKEGAAAPKDAVAVQGKKFLRLKIGETVKKGQLLAQLDDRLARDELNTRLARIRAAEADYVAAEAASAEARHRYVTCVALR